MVPRLSHLSSLNCESCQLGKHTRVSFPKYSRFRAESPFHLVHTDVWGPSRVSSSLGFRYFVTFIDDYSRCTWLFLMKNRSELLSIFQLFCAEIKTQFGVSIRILRSDNAREYFSTSFQHFMTSQGMLHQSSCSHTPQQNGVAERKNRYLIETARTLLLHGHVPLRFWGDAVLTACYLINRMPSSTLHNKIPYSIIFPNHPLYSLPLRIFGCICFVHDLTPRQDKLSSKSFKCIFLGYSRLKKGYKCYCPDKNLYFISADVTFFEESSFFPSTIPESPSISEALPVPYLGPNDCISSAPLPDLLADTVDVPDDSPSVPTPSRASDLASPPILRRGTCNPYPIYTFLSYHRLSSPYYAFVSSLSSISVPKSTSDALAYPEWRQAMIDKMNALHTNGTWELVSLPSGKSTVGCKWVYTVKVHPDGSVDRLKARLVAKGYTQVHGDDNHGIQQLKSFLQSKFQTKDLGQLKYFLGIEVARSQLGICLSQRKYCLDVLSDIGMLDSKPVDTPMDPNTKLVPDEGELLTNPEQYRRLVGKLNYLTVTRLDIAFVTSMVSQFLSQPRTSHWNAVIRILRYLKTASERDYYIRIMGTL
ncbi:Retrovirus-related Pol polyprotein from transposon TNT 1-94 [Quillaja saponaria]|uniref:Retrovirus-related Pol polyprotein from transposon TNT 1-94 n=1 Tax=Quillaja saponaria TaxID=32244 RepID=A0AAD7QCM2_QUISA|nr:Retrovirus-related Pol polyprotein from transposon TNT 1-94 [Quillaja saponaria]